MSGFFLLAVIYLAFISLGLPDTVLGVAWPTMRQSLNLPLEAAGIFTMVATLGTAFSSFISGHILGKLGTGKVIFASCLVTGLSLLGYSAAPSFGWLLLLTVPLGLGAGAVDTGLNNYVANNYSSRHMSWLHCFWGVGAFLGPNIMNSFIVNLDSWRAGYRIIGFTQLSIALILLGTLPLWKNNEGHKQILSNDGDHVKVRGLSLFRKKGVVLSILAFPLYVGVEAGTGLWLGSYLIEGRNIAQAGAGMMVALFYAAITIGRFVNGLIANRTSNRNLIRIGISLMVVGVALFNIPLDVLLIPSITLIGLGCAPIFPSMVHETPRLFGSVNSQAITGYQIGMAYLSGVVITPVIGLLASRVSISMIPISIAFFTVAILLITERLNHVASRGS